MNTVKILIEGFAKMTSENTWEATCTTTLIESKGKKIIMDPGCDRKLLEEAFLKHELEFEDIDGVFLSHRHLDHSILIGLFPNAIVFDEELQHQGKEGAMHSKMIPGTDIEILSTPGHAPKHASLLVETNEGSVAIAADVFWWYEDEEQTVDIEKEDDSADGKFEDLKKSRKLLLKKADWIIPGHGKKFKVEK